MNNWYHVGVPMGLASTNDPKALAKQVADAVRDIPGLQNAPAVWVVPAHPGEAVERAAQIAGTPDYQYSYSTEDGNTFGNVIGACGMPHDYDDEVLNDSVNSCEVVIQRL